MKQSLQEFNKEIIDQTLVEMNQLEVQNSNDILNDTNKNVTNLSEHYMNQQSSDKKQDVPIINYNAPEEAFIKKNIENRQKTIVQFLN